MQPTCVSVSRAKVAEAGPYLELSEGVGVIGESQGVECLSGVHLVQTLAGGSAVHAVALNEGHEDDLQSKGHILQIRHISYGCQP